MTGTITRVVADRGFGFIKGDNSTDYYFHRQEVGGGLDFARLKPGDRVTFEEQHGSKGPRAGSVRPTS
jgi:cold shock CspA family protein